MPALLVWENGVHLATWRFARGSHELRYEPGWIGSHTAHPLSLSLPFTPGNIPHRGQVVSDYFDNLLPDSAAIRLRMRSRFGTASAEAFDLLTAVGRDCVGSIQLLPDGDEPAGWNQIKAETLTDAAAERSIDAMLSGGRTLGHAENDDFRISIAGAQEKIAFLRRRGRWCRPTGATPTTHILKLPLGIVGALQMDMRDSVENEWLCLKLLKAFGLDVPGCELAQIGRWKTLAVERFDRVTRKGGWIERVAQEDFCQALGLSSTLKYESDGGPGMKDVIRILDAGSNATHDKRAFIKSQILFWLLAATDGHAKNFSIFLEPGGHHRLTPFYDVLSAWPVIGRRAGQLDPMKAKLAMAVRSKNAHWKLKEITPRHWDAVTRMAGLGDSTSLLHEIATTAPKAIVQVEAGIPKGFPPVVHDRIFENILTGIARLER